MNRVGLFEKVSLDQFKTDLKSLFDMSVIEVMYDSIQLPTRATSGSAGYDFYLPYAIHLRPGETATIPTGIRVKIDDGWWLCCTPRSSLGFKSRMQLDNTIGVIDADYYYSDNEGHIFAKITNDTNTGKPLVLDAGERFMQGIFLPFGITDDDNATKIRSGGLGSTGK